MATQRLQIYKCSVCGIVAEILDSGAGEPVCCGRPMALLGENTVDASKEKHVPVVERVGDGIRVKVGSVAHPMEEKHYIQWIEVTSGGMTYREFLSPGQAPQAFFPITMGEVTVRELCNIHGLWKA